MPRQRQESSSVPFLARALDHLRASGARPPHPLDSPARSERGDPLAHPLWRRLREDPEIDELFIPGCRPSSIVYGHRAASGDALFTTTCEAMKWVQDLAEACSQRLDALNPWAGGVISGFRWHCILPPIAPDGPLIAIRRHRFSTLALPDLVGEPQLSELDRAISNRRPLLISGATGSGKTTLLAALMRHFASADRLCLIETVDEIATASNLWCKLVERAPNYDDRGRVSSCDLLREALRMTPSWIVIGEIRGREARTWIDASMSGHTTAAATIHASTPAAALLRLLDHSELDQGQRRAVVNYWCRGNSPVVVQMHPPPARSISTIDDTAAARL